MNPLFRFHPWRFSLAVSAVASLALGIVGARTPSDVDEGFYALAAELVAHGRVPYRDFFYPQAPYLPYLLAPIALLGSRLLLERIVMALCCGATAGLIAHGVRRATGAYIPAIAAACLYTLHELTWQWGPSVRAYGVASLLATAAAVLLSAPVRPSLQRSFAAGVLVGVMTGTRFLLAPAAGALVAAAWLRGASFPRVRAVVLVTLMLPVVWAAPIDQPHALAWTLPLALMVLAVGGDAFDRAARGISAALGALVALAPAVWMYLSDRERFVFDNFGFHANRVAADVSPYARVPYLHVLFGLPVAVPTNHGSALGPESMLLFTFALAGILVARSRATIAPALGAAGMVIASLALLPVMDHYYTPAVPLTALCAGLGLGATMDRHRGWLRRSGVPIAAVVVTVIVGLPSFHTRWVYGYYNQWDLSAFRPRRVDRGAALVRSVAEAHPGPVLGLWPGSVLGLATRVVPGTENHFARRAELPDGDPDTARRLRVMSSTALWRLIVLRVPSVVAVDREAGHEGGEDLRHLLEHCGYRVEAELPGTVEAYARDAEPTAECL